MQWENYKEYWVIFFLHVFIWSFTLNKPALEA